MENKLILSIVTKENSPQFFIFNQTIPPYPRFKFRREDRLFSNNKKTMGRKRKTNEQVKYVTSLKFSHQRINKRRHDFRIR